MLRLSCLCLAPKTTGRSISSTLLSSPPGQTALNWTSKGIQIRLHVKPNSKVDRILDLQEDCLRVCVTEAAREGKANRGIIDLMSRVLGARKSEVTIVAGQRSREKIMFVSLARYASSEHDRREHLAQIVGKLKEAIAR